MEARAWLDEVTIDPEVVKLRPDYRAVVIVGEGLEPGPSDAASDALLTRAEEFGRQALSGGLVEDLPEVAAWRDAYRAFGAKPQRTRPSLEALLRRVDAGLPRVDRLTDVYNALSVLCLVPIGGEDLSAYSGPARLVRAVGDEAFDTTRDREVVVEHPVTGEVVWRDDLGVTCRMWNWRQCVRTRITETTRTALFIVDLLDPPGSGTGERQGESLFEQFRATNPSARLTGRVLGSGATGRLLGSGAAEPQPWT